MKRTFTSQEARKIGEQVGIDFDQIDLEQFRMGLTVEFEHGSHDPETNVTDDDVPITAKITWAHLKELPDYYTRLHKMEHEAESKSETANTRTIHLSTDKKIFGLCGGIAEYLEVDPTVVRLGWVVMTIISGVLPGVVAYFVAALIVPKP